MANEIALVPTEDWAREKVDLIKRTIAVGASDDELQLFLYTCKRTGLDPLAKQIHMVKRWNSNAGREVATIQTGIDGYRLIADRTGKLAGISDPVYGSENAAGHPTTASVTVYKMVDGIKAEFSASARFTEYVQTKRDGSPNSMWAKMPYLMLGKCAEALALRKAFPADLSGLYTADEMAQADSEPPVPTPPAPAVAEARQDSVFRYDAPNLTCQPVDVEKRRTKDNHPKDFIAIKLNGECEGKRMAFCWHTSMHDALLSSIGKIIGLVVELSGDYLNIKQVLCVGDTAFTAPQTPIEAVTDGTTDPDLPF